MLLPVLTWAQLVSRSGTDVGYATTRAEEDRQLRLAFHSIPPAFAMPGTDKAQGRTTASVRPVQRCTVLPPADVMSGTDVVQSSPTRRVGTRASRIERSAARYKAVNTVTDFLFPGCGWSKVEPPAKTLRGKTLERRKNEGNEDPEVHSQVKGWAPYWVSYAAGGARYCDSVCGRDSVCGCGTGDSVWVCGTCAEIPNVLCDVRYRGGVDTEIAYVDTRTLCDARY
eukprot:2547409-Rhodomonas_salina.3